MFFLFVTEPLLDACSDSDTERRRETKQGSVHPRVGGGGGKLGPRFPASVSLPAWWPLRQFPGPPRRADRYSGGVFVKMCVLGPRVLS